VDIRLGEAQIIRAIDDGGVSILTNPSKTEEMYQEKPMKTRRIVTQLKFTLKCSVKSVILNSTTT